MLTGVCLVLSCLVLSCLVLSCLVLSCLVLSDQGGKTLGIIGLGLYLSLQTHNKTFLTKSKRPRFSPRQQAQDIAWVETQRVIYVMFSGAYGISSAAAAAALGLTHRVLADDL
eukprot:COSAG06_NODE_29130_length_562_cov_0.784017_2_plen_112_part_01